MWSPTSCTVGCGGVMPFTFPLCWLLLSLSPLIWKILKKKKKNRSKGFIFRWVHSPISVVWAPEGVILLDAWHFFPCNSSSQEPFALVLQTWLGSKELWQTVKSPHVRESFRSSHWFMSLSVFCQGFFQDASSCRYVTLKLCRSTGLKIGSLRSSASSVHLTLFKETVDHFCFRQWWFTDGEVMTAEGDKGLWIVR